jgi:hypothetical protein
MAAAGVAEAGGHGVDGGFGRRRQDRAGGVRVKVDLVAHKKIAKTLKRLLGSCYCWVICYKVAPEKTF